MAIVWRMGEDDKRSFWLSEVKWVSSKLMEHISQVQKMLQCSLLCHTNSIKPVVSRWKMAVRGCVWCSSYHTRRYTGIKMFDSFVARRKWITNSFLLLGCFVLFQKECLSFFTISIASSRIHQQNLQQQQWTHSSPSETSSELLSYAALKRKWRRNQRFSCSVRESVMTSNELHVFQSTVLNWLNWLLKWSRWRTQNLTSCHSIIFCVV